MESHLTIILERLEKLAAGSDPKATYNFEREGEVVATVSFDPEGAAFNIKYPGQKQATPFDSIDLVAIEIFDLIY
jgi:uncharacterized protein YkuJ